MARRRDDVLAKGLPWLVAERDGAVLGYAYAKQFRPRRAYRFCLEDSIYLDADAPRPGLGRLLLAELMAQLRGARRAADAGGDRRLGQCRLDRRAPRAAASATPASLKARLEVRPLARRGVHAEDASGRAPPRRRPTDAATDGRATRSKTLATWLALVGGSLGAAPLLPARPARRLGLAAPAGRRSSACTASSACASSAQDDRVVVAAGAAARADAGGGMLSAIVYGLTPDERWDARTTPAHAARRTRLADRCSASSSALMIGATVLMATIAFSGQRYFECAGRGLSA